LGNLGWGVRLKWGFGGHIWDGESPFGGEKDFFLSLFACISSRVKIEEKAWGIEKNGEFLEEIWRRGF